MSSTRHSTAIAGLLLGLSLAACATEPTGSLEHTLRIEGAEDRWRAAHLTNYSFNSTVYCFCLDEFVGTKRVTVREGRVISVVDARTGVLNPVTWRQPIDSLFALVRREALANPELLDVSFDGRLGFPRRISYGDQPVDAGGIITIDDVRPNP